MKNILQLEMKTVSAAGSPEIVKSEKLPDNEIVCIQRISLRNATNPNSKATPVIIAGKSRWYIETITLTSDGSTYSVKEPLFVKGATRIEVEFSSTTSGDILEVWVYGYFVGD